MYPWRTNDSDGLAGHRGTSVHQRNMQFSLVFLCIFSVRFFVGSWRRKRKIKQFIFLPPWCCGVHASLLLPFLGQPVSGSCMWPLGRSNLWTICRFSFGCFFLKMKRGGVIFLRRERVGIRVIINTSIIYYGAALWHSGLEDKHVQEVGYRWLTFIRQSSRHLWTFFLLDSRAALAAVSNASHIFSGPTEHSNVCRTNLDRHFSVPVKWWWVIIQQILFIASR
jgi:hypothetical protein